MNKKSLKNFPLFYLYLLFYFLLFSFLLISCLSLDPLPNDSSYTLRVKVLDTSLADIQKAVLRSLPFGKRKIQAKGRKFYSRYFLVQGEEFLKIEESSPPVRYFAEIFILGFHRPYSVEVSVYKEELVSNPNEYDLSESSNYLVTEKDRGKAQIVLNRIQKQLLSLGRKNPSFIDEFRAF